MRVRGAMIGLALLAMPVAGAAQEAARECPVKPVLEAPWEAWAVLRPGKAGHQAGDAKTLLLGSALTASLHPIAHVQYPAKPGKPVTAGTFGGTFRLNLAKPSRVGIALSDAAWLDVAIGTALAVSLDHGHGPDCSGIRKIVWFDLPRGANIVQIANAPGETIRIMAVEKPAG